jgi:DNA-directed RNA polymerase subunit RPC12/RpoP
MIWFDQYESSALSTESVIELFKQIHKAQKRKDVTRTLVSNHMRCPSCASALKLTNDLQKSGRFTYHRCANGHGRASSFTQFLQEKHFIRTLTRKEIKTLAVKSKQIRCSSCGASVNLEKDTACTYCGSAISVLDNDAVEKALSSLAEKQREKPSAEAIADALLNTPSPTPARGRERPPDTTSSSLLGILRSPVDDGALADLVDLGIGIVIRRLLD